MFLFKCCSNHSLPNFLKSTKSPGKGQVNKSTTPNLNVCCSKEVLDNVGSRSAEVLSCSTDVDDGRPELKKEASSVENLSCKWRSSDEREHRLVINSIKRPPIEIHSSSSNSIVLLVGNNRVKTSLLKHYSSCDSTFSSENIKQRNGRRRAQSEGKASSGITQAKQFHASKTSAINEEEFMFEALQAICVDRTEIVLKKSLIRRRLPANEFKSFVLEKQKVDYVNCLKAQKEVICQGRNADSSVILGDSIFRNNHEILSSICPEDLDSQIMLEETISDVKQRNSDVKARRHQELIDANYPMETDDSLVSRANEAFDALKRTKTLEVVSGLYDGGFCRNSSFQKDRSEYDVKDSFNVETKQEQLVQDDSRGVDCPPLKHEGLTQLLAKPQEVNNIPNSVVSCPTFGNGGQTVQTSRICSNSSIDVLLAGETASFLEEFLPREEYFPAVQFTILNDLISPSTSDDSTRNLDDESVSNDSLLSEKSTDAATAFRPRDLKESQVIFSSSPDNEPSDESVQNNSGNNSMTDSLLGSPECPSGGLDFRHFYSKSLPNLDRQPYDGISSLGLIEEYFNRYIVECNEGEGKCCGSQVDPNPHEPPDDSGSSGKVCTDDQNRQHSLERLTEICKRFSSTYLNFLHSTHGTDPDIVNLNSDRDVQCPSENIRLDPVDSKDLGADNNALSALYAAMFSHHDSKEFSRAKTPPKCDSPEDQIPSRKPSLVGRSVSLMETPGSGAKKIVKKKKAVKFADSFGLELAIVRLILSGENLSDQDFQQRFQASGVQQCGNNVVHNNSNNNAVKNSPTKQTETRKIVSTFVQPESSEDFLQRVEALSVTLESCLPEEKSRSVSGCIRVKNLSYEKTVLVRYTLNDWLSYNETSASYVLGSNNGRTDRFSFSIKLPSFFDVGSAIEFAIMYRTHDGREFWDNNGGVNYRMTCQKC